MRTIIRGMIVLLAFGGLTTVAKAHAMLDHASPAVGSSVSGSPGVIRMWFTEALEPRFSGAEVAGPSGNRVGGGASVSGNQLSVSVPHLAPGTYRVQWHVISVDTHKTEGSFTFDVRP
jgi:copper resistance protein C